MMFAYLQEFFYNNLSKIVCLESFATFLQKHLHQSLFFNKVSSLHPDVLSKKDSYTSVFLRLLRKFIEQSFDRAIPGDGF